MDEGRGAAWQCMHERDEADVQRTIARCRPPASGALAGAAREVDRWLRGSSWRELWSEPGGDATGPAVDALRGLADAVGPLRGRDGACSLGLDLPLPAQSDRGVVFWVVAVERLLAWRRLAPSCLWDDDRLLLYLGAPPPRALLGWLRPELEDPGRCLVARHGSTLARGDSPGESAPPTPEGRLAEVLDALDGNGETRLTWRRR
jgi:hypothetical protein